jgi:hypothetical protein
LVLCQHTFFHKTCYCFVDGFFLKVKTEFGTVLLHFNFGLISAVYIQLRCSGNFGGITIHNFFFPLFLLPTNEEQFSLFSLFCCSKVRMVVVVGPVVVVFSSEIVFFFLLGQWKLF